MMMMLSKQIFRVCLFLYSLLFQVSPVYKASHPYAGQPIFTPAPTCIPFSRTRPSRSCCCCPHLSYACAVRRKLDRQTRKSLTQHTWMGKYMKPPPKKNIKLSPLVYRSLFRPEGGNSLSTTTLDSDSFHMQGVFAQCQHRKANAGTHTHTYTHIHPTRVRAEAIRQGAPCLLNSNNKELLLWHGKCCTFFA